MMTSSDKKAQNVFDRKRPHRVIYGHSTVQFEQRGALFSPRGELITTSSVAQCLGRTDGVVLIIDGIEYKGDGKPANKATADKMMAAQEEAERLAQEAAEKEAAELLEQENSVDEDFSDDESEEDDEPAEEPSPELQVIPASKKPGKKKESKAKKPADPIEGM